VPPAFGAYRVLHQIGSGVLGPVFRTYDPQRDRLIAVKAFRLDIVPEQVARLAEAMRRLAASDLNHPAIVHIVDAGLEGTTAYLAMEFVAAETLDVALRHLAPSPVDRAWPILAQIAEAIEAAWARGVGHGALHPRDIFVTSATNDVRVTGFGVVPALESVGVKPPVRRPYAAPERAAGDAWDIRADVYSLGAVAHELLTRRRPAGPSEQDGALVTGTTPEQRVLIRRVLSAALAERPEHRFATPHAFVAALEAIVKGEPLGALPIGSEASEERPRAEAEAPPPQPVVPAVPAASAPASPAAPVPPRPADTEPAPIAAAIVPAEPTPVRMRRPERRVDGGAPPIQPAASRIDPQTSADRSVAAAAQERAPAPPVYMPIRVPPPAFPWAAVVAAFVAGIALGGVGAYSYALGRAKPAPLQAVTPVRPNDTEVSVPESTPPATAAPPSAADTSQVAPGAPAGRAGAPPASAASAPQPAPPPARTAAQAAGRVLVRSVPSGAALTIDGHAHGPTPATVRDLSLGTHTLLVSHPGYTPHTEKVTLTAEQPARNLTIELKPTRSGRGASGPAPNGPRIPGGR
jgi:serine/threonine-protein kinase